MGTKQKRKMEHITEFFIQPSDTQPNMMILVAVSESGQKYVVGGDHWNPSVLQMYENSFHVAAQKAGEYPEEA